MRLHATALSLTAGLIWGAAIFLVAAANLMWPDYGHSFLQLTASIYPGYQPGAGSGSVIIGALYGFVDGAVGGAVFAWMYNFLVGRFSGGTA